MAFNDVLDCVIVGGGPGGLTAALYLGRFRRSVIVIDADESRAALIPVSHNFPAFPNGVTGPHLLSRLRQQLAPYGINVLTDRAISLKKTEDLFDVEMAGHTVSTRRVIIATGIADHGMSGENWRIGVEAGGLRLCPVCDAYEVIDKDVAVIARTEGAAAHALFLRDYTDRLTLYHVGDEANFSRDDTECLRRAGVALLHSNSAAVEVDIGGRAGVRHAGTVRFFDAVYPMFGCHPRSDLLRSLGAACTAEGKLITDIYQETSVPGVFAIGDVVSGLNQISVAMGQAAIAATHLHQSLRP
ncbi:MAG: NAD(P)/FAD-dependent oxidoreductase [Asticcacaulis sp.]|uniref:NAD(P)/FAD-dependent oxidoreductase n=1 Tax=Asticcacaulis sp. TaxID=1872648 RepID=UPI0039E6F85E